MPSRLAASEILGVFLLGNGWWFWFWWTPVEEPTPSTLSCLVNLMRAGAENFLEPLHAEGGSASGTTVLVWSSFRSFCRLVGGWSPLDPSETPTPGSPLDPSAWTSSVELQEEDEEDEECLYKIKEKRSN